MPSNPIEKDRPTASLLTLGCKVNQFESAGLSRILKRAGYTLIRAGLPADLTVLNTCTVTHRADREARALVRKTHRANPRAVIVVTGCLAQTDPEEAAAWPGVSLVLGQDDKPGLLDFLPRLHDREQPLIQVGPPGRRELKPLTLDYPVFDRTRAFFRIQDGCSAVCSYCLVPRARGPSRSLDRTQVLNGIDRYQKAGYAEVVLTGIHLGAWGQDLAPPEKLSSLLQEVLAKEGFRLRLSSIEPDEIDSDLIDLLARSKRLAPHLHLPLQSGSDNVLAAMRRPYLVDDFKRLVGLALTARPDICLGADVMVGFPGESPEEFEETRKLISQMPLAYLHVFPFSPRPGTLAVGLPGRVPPSEIKKRAAILRRLGQEKKRVYQNRFLQQIRPTLIENTKDPSTGLSRGLTDNYITVLMPGSDPPPGAIIPIRLLNISSEGRVYGLPAV